MPKNKGFTLIELLVVVAIIGLLSSIVLTALASAKERALVSEVIQEAQSFKKAMEIYRSATGNYYDTNYYVRSQSVTEWPLFIAAMNPYIKIQNVSFLQFANNAHYIDGSMALTSIYNTCGGVQVQSNGYIVFFIAPTGSASNFKTETSSGYSCFLND